MARPLLAAAIIAVYIAALTISIVNFPSLEPYGLTSDSVKT